MTFDNIFARFDVCFLGDALGSLSCPFRSTVLQCGARLQVDLKLVHGP